MRHPRFLLSFANNSIYHVKIDCHLVNTLDSASPVSSPIQRFANILQGSYASRLWVIHSQCSIRKTLGNDDVSAFPLFNFPTISQRITTGRFCHFFVPLNGGCCRLCRISRELVCHPFTQRFFPCFRVYPYFVRVIRQFGWASTSSPRIRNSCATTQDWQLM